MLSRTTLIHFTALTAGIGWRVYFLLLMCFAAFLLLHQAIERVFSTQTTRMTVRLCSVPQLNYLQHESLWYVIRSMVPGNNLTAIDYNSCVTKRIVHMTIALTMFMAITLHQSVLLQALMVEIHSTAIDTLSAVSHARQERAVHTHFAFFSLCVSSLLAFLLKCAQAKRSVCEQFDRGNSE